MRTHENSPKCLGVSVPKVLQQADLGWPRLANGFERHALPKPHLFVQALSPVLRERPHRVTRGSGRLGARATSFFVAAEGELMALGVEIDLRMSVITSSQPPTRSRTLRLNLNCCLIWENRLHFGSLKPCGLGRLGPCLHRGST